MKDNILIMSMQKVFRKLLKSMSQPGVISCVGEAENIDYNFNCLPVSMLLMSVLLDAEVKFYVESNEKDLKEQISRLTYSTYAKIYEADYIFVCMDNREQLRRIISEAKRGTLSDPHEGATIIIEVENISNNETLILTGPGIKEKAYLSVPLSSSWIEARDEANKEFPMGVDIIFADRNNNLAALPRTTKIERRN